MAVKHTKFFIKQAMFSIIVDGNLEWENELAYPFSGGSTNCIVPSTDCQWIVGLGFCGYISSFTVYADTNIDPQLLKLQFEQGYGCKSLKQGK